MNQDIRPQLWVIAGPNGAGKSTFVAKQSLASQIHIINPDEIAKRIDPIRRNETAVIAQAGREALLERRGLMAQGQSFGIETTLTGRGEILLMQQAKEQGYKVNLVYVGISDAKQSNTRVAFRVSQGGHDVPESDIMRRFDRSLSNLPEAIKVADRSFVLDNSARQYRLLFSLEKENVRFVSKDLPAWSKEALSKAGISLEGRAFEKTEMAMQLGPADLSAQLHRGQVQQDRVAREASLQVLERAAAQQRLILRDGDALGRPVQGEVVAGSSQHVLVRISDMVALAYERGKLDRAVSVGERLVIEPGQEKHRVHEQNQAFDKDHGRDPGLGRER